MKQEKLPFCNTANRFLWARCLLASILLFSASAWADGNLRPLRIALPMKATFTQFSLITDWQQYPEQTASPGGIRQQQKIP